MLFLKSLSSCAWHCDLVQISLDSQSLSFVIWNSGSQHPLEVPVAHSICWKDKIVGIETMSTWCKQDIHYLSSCVVFEISCYSVAPAGLKIMPILLPLTLSTGTTDINHFFKHYLAIEILFRDFWVFLIILDAIKSLNKLRFDQVWSGEWCLVRRNCGSYISQAHEGSLGLFWISLSLEVSC